MIGVLTAVAAAGALIVTLLQVANITTQLNALMAEGTEIQSQLFIARISLADKVTCSLNFSDISVNQPIVTVGRVLRIKNPSGDSLSDSPIFPATGVNSIESLSIRQIPNQENFVFLDLNFNRNKALSGGTVTRSIPLSIVKSGNKIVSCSAKDAVEDDSEQDSPDSNLANLGNCDSAPLPEIDRLSNSFSYESQMSASRDTLCNNLTYPISSTGEIPCSDITKVRNAAGPSNYPAINQFMDRHVQFTISVSGFRAGCTMAGERSFASGLAGVKSADGCRKLALRPMGMTVPGDPGNAFGGYVAPKICINGRWQSIPVDRWGRGG